MMSQFLSIVLREQFTFFYRAGYTFIPNTELIFFEGELESDRIKEKVFEKFKTLTPFFYDQEYLILHLEKETTSESDFIQFEIQDIVAIYPLSKEAKASIESKIDQRIRLETPIFETVLQLIKTEIENKEVEKAISALWKICKIESPLEKYVANIGLENIFNGLEFRRHGTKANKIQNGNYWEYLIAYDYYQYFPEGTIRYFYQLGEVFSYYKGKINGIEGTKIEEILNQIGGGNFEQILQKFNNQTLPSSFIETMNEIGKSDFNPIIVSVLFLKWKADLIKKDTDILNSSVFYKGKIVFIDKFPTEVRLALVLLGAFFGFRKFYDNYYEALNLRFYKDYKPLQKQTDKEELQEKVDTILETDNSVKTVTEEEQVKETQTETTNEEKLIETTSVEEQNLLTKEQQAEMTVGKHNDISNTQQDDNKEVVSDFTSQYQKIIEDLLQNQVEVKLTEIKGNIKKQLNETKTVDEIKEIIVKLKIEVESVQGKTNTIKKLNS